MPIVPDKPAVLAASLLLIASPYLFPSQVSAQANLLTPSLKNLHTLHTLVTATVNNSLLSLSSLLQKDNTFNPQADFITTTNEQGRAELDVIKGVYKLSASIPDSYDLIIPRHIITKSQVLNRKNVVYLGLTPGNGRVFTYKSSELDDKPYAKRKSPALLSLAPSNTQVLGATDQAPDNAQTEVTFQLYQDLNKNGRKEPNEPFTNTADIELALETADDGVIYSLLNGWNLVHFPLEPSTFTTASELIAEIAKEGGYVTTVATWQDGQWLEYIQRGDETFSENDFPIEPGRAYFLRSHQKMDWLVVGYHPEKLPQVHLEPGWNSVGLFPANHQAADILDHLNQNSSTENATEIDRWFSGNWDTFVKRLYSQDNIREYGNNFEISNQEGYMIKSDTFTTIDFKDLQ